MTKNFRLGGFGGVALCALLASGCGEEDAKKGLVASGDPSTEGDGDGDGDGDDESEDKAPPSSDEFPDTDAAVDVDLDGGPTSDAGADPSIGKPGVTTPGTVGTLLSLPHD